MNDTDDLPEKATETPTAAARAPLLAEIERLSLSIRGAVGIIEERTLQYNEALKRAEAAERERAQMKLERDLANERAKVVESDIRWLVGHCLSIGMKRNAEIPFEETRDCHHVALFICDLKRRAEVAERERDALKAEIERLKEQIETQIGAINRSWQRAQWLESERDALRTEIERLRHELADAHGVAQACELRAEAAERKLDALKADAERYRWLMEEADSSVMARIDRVYRSWNGEGGADGFAAAIDAAMKGKE